MICMVLLLLFLLLLLGHQRREALLAGMQIGVADGSSGGGGVLEPAPEGLDLAAAFGPFFI